MVARTAVVARQAAAVAAEAAAALPAAGAEALSPAQYNRTNSFIFVHTNIHISVV